MHINDLQLAKYRNTMKFSRVMSLPVVLTLYFLAYCGNNEIQLPHL